MLVALSTTVLSGDHSPPDPRSLLTPAQLEKQGVKDFQLDYALKTLKRLAPKGATLASASGPKPKSR